MKHFTVIGNPVKHSLSPKMHSWIFANLEIEAEFTKTHTESNDLQKVVGDIRSGKIDGMNVTIPHKESIMKYLDGINPRAELIGSVNCIMNSQEKIIGNNTDWFGFTKLLKFNNIQVTNKEVIVLGAGGVARAVIFALKQMGVEKIRLLNRTVSRAQLLEDEIVTAHWIDHAENFVNEKSIIINCTSVGMYNNDMPLPIQLIMSNQILIDTIYTPLKTSFLRSGDKIGAKTINGLEMFIHQGIASLELWLGESIEGRIDFDELKKYLEKQI